MPVAGDTAVAVQAVRRKVAWRIVPLLFVLYVISYLDRANVSFAKLRMQEAFGWSDEVFGLGFGVFFVGYVVLEIPGALLVEHWSARKWFTRILITWGLCSMAMAFVRTPAHFYLARFLLGLAEAGFFPGVIVYLTHWFPRAERARALAGFIFGVPLSLGLGANLSGYLMEQDWWSLAGWQWVFLLEGLPAVLMGLALPFLLTDRPRQAKWLRPEERDWLEQTLAREHQEAAKAGSITLRQALRQPSVWLLALGILATNTGGYAMGFWMPTFLNNRLRTPTAALNFLSIMYVFGLAGVWVTGQSSDRTGDRKWHCVAGQGLTAVFLAVSVIPGQPMGLMLAWLCLIGFFAYFWPPPFWVLPTLTMSSTAAALAIGFINICANLAGVLGPPIVGYMKGTGVPDAICLLFAAAGYLLGGIIVAGLRVNPERKTIHE